MNVDNIAKTNVAPWLAALPNLITLSALASGMTAIMFAISGELSSAVACLIIAMVFDACDGRVARYVGTSSKFGAELDSLSDVVCFGAAPSLILYMWGLDEKALLGWAVCISLTLATALRLARFNVAVDVPNKPKWASAFFQGVPSPAGGFLALLPFIVSEAGLFSVGVSQIFAIYWVPFVAWLMVSNVPTFSGKLVEKLLGRTKLLMTLVLLLVSCVMWIHGVWATLVLLSLGYILFLPLSIMRYKQLSLRN